MTCGRVGRAAASIATLAMVCAACVGAQNPASLTSSGTSPERPASPSQLFTPTPAAPSPTGSPIPNAFCPKTGPMQLPPAGSSQTPAAVRQIEDQVAGIRGLTFLKAVAPEAVSQGQMGQILRAAQDASLPVQALANRQAAWMVMGAIPPGTDLRRALIDFARTQVIGFYDDRQRRLVFVGSAVLDPFQRYVLAHELTHALQDQHFDLGRLESLAAACQDERANAFTALAEGDAVESSGIWAGRFLSGAQRVKLQQEVSSFPGLPASVPRFLERSEAFPYVDGQRFVAVLLARGGEAAVDAAFRQPPVSTEQILHPDRYPSDVPLAVPVPAAGPPLGDGWRQVDQMEVGEGFLRDLLALRLPGADAATAAADWGGGIYGAWTNGSKTAVVMATVWDTTEAATRFAQAMQRFVTAAGLQATVAPDGAYGVDVGFASDPDSLARLGSVLPFVGG